MSTTAQSGAATPLASYHGQRAGSRSAWWIALTVIGLHAAAILFLMFFHRPEPVAIVPPPVISAVLLGPEPTPAPPTPPLPKTVEPPKPQTPPHPVTQPRKAVHRPTPAPRLTPVTNEPSTVAAAPAPAAPAATPAPPAPAAPPVAQTAAPAPAVDPNIPKNVRHLSCQGGQPDYPPLSKRRGETGTVVIQLIVGLDGRVESAKVKTSSGFDRLDTAARDAALSMRCSPLMDGNQVVKAATERPYSFNLTD